MYISTNKGDWKIVKKQINIIDGKPIYKNLLEVVCEECKRIYLQEISINEINNPNLICPFCSNFGKNNISL